VNVESFAFAVAPARIIRSKGEATTCLTQGVIKEETTLNALCPMQHPCLKSQTGITRLSKLLPNRSTRLRGSDHFCGWFVRTPPESGGAILMKRRLAVTQSQQLRGYKSSCA
jgi:hypothetical protein